VGCVLLRTSLGISMREGTKGRYILLSVMSDESKTANMAPRINAETESLANFVFAMIDPKPTPRMGDIRGATSIAPMITAGESFINPSVAIALESTTRRK